MRYVSRVFYADSILTIFSAVSSIYIFALLGFLVILTPCIGRAVEAFAVKIVQANKLLTMIVVVPSLLAQAHKCGSPAFWQDVMWLQKRFAARTVFVGSIAFTGLLLVQVVQYIFDEGWQAHVPQSETRPIRSQAAGKDLPS